MEEVMLATDVVLKSMIAPAARSLTELISQAKRGEIYLTMSQSVLYYAFQSVRESDKIRFDRFCELLKYSQIVSDEPQYLGPQERESWQTDFIEVENWRSLALETD